MPTGEDGESEGGFGGTREVDLIATQGGRRRTENFKLNIGRPGTLAENYPADIGSSQAVSLAWVRAIKAAWSVSGTNATAALVTIAANGGLTLTTAGASGDQMVLQPLNINGVQMNALGWTTWRPEYRLIYRVLITTGASIADVRLLFGLKLAFGTTTGAEDHDVGATITDEDYVLFAFDTTHASSATLWHMCGGNTGVDENSPASAFKSSSTVRASTQTLLEIVVDANRVPHFVINGEEVGQLSALKAGSVSLIPFVGIQALTGSAKSVTIEDGEISMGV